MKKFISILLIAILVLSLGACTADTDPDKDVDEKEPIENVEDNNQNNKDDNDTSQPIPETNSQEVVLYFANTEYVETGNEELEHLIPEERLVEYNDTSLEEAIVRELIKGPESEGLSSPIPSTIQLLGVEVSEGTAYVDFANEGLHGGSLQEYFTIEEIVNSLLELDSVDRVQFLIDGEKSDSLMGHYEIVDPFE